MKMTHSLKVLQTTKFDIFNISAMFVGWNHSIHKSCASHKRIVDGSRDFVTSTSRSRLVSKYRVVVAHLPGVGACSPMTRIPPFR